MAAEMLDQATPVHLPLDVRRHRRHRRRRRAHREHLHDGRGRHRRGRGAGRQARRPRRVVVLRVPPTCSRRSGVAIDLPAAAVARCVAGGRHRLLLRAGLPPGHAARRPRRAGRWASAPSSTSSGPLTNPARPVAAAIGCADPRMAPVHGRRPRRARRPRAGVPRRRRPRRADHGDDVVGLGGPRRRGRARPAGPVGPRHPGVRRRTPCAAATPAFNADVFRRVLDGRAGAGARRGAAERGGGAGGLRRAGRPAARRARRRAWSAAAAAVDDGRAAALLDRWVAVSRQPREDGRRRRSVGGLEADREGGLEVVPGVGAEGDVRLGLEDARAPC